ncbi:MAG TPA: glycosyltransferase family 4 protein, partial [Candidatus Binatia bacterium]|nr:glycosyltransferase family 4 protein [Candidatus Binatia bacterium]
PMTHPGSGCVTVFTPSDAAAHNTNAQNLTVKEVVARLPEDFHVAMLCDGAPDPRLAARPNTTLVRWHKHGNTLRLLRHCLFPPPDIYFFPRRGPLDRAFFDLRRRMKLKTSLITYIVMAMDSVTGAGLTARSIREADMVFANSKFVAQTVRDMFGVKAARIYDGIDRRYYFPANESVTRENFRVLYAGSLQARKRPEIVIRQAARYPQIEFRIAGKGEMEAPCRALAENLGCRNVIFLGHLSSQELGAEMRAAGIFLFPSILEGNPQVLLQAAACGLPCVAMDLYQSDYVVQNQTGLLAHSDDELSAALDNLVNDPSTRRSFAAAAIEHANRFDWDDIAKKWAAVFHQAVALRQSRRALTA